MEIKSAAFIKSSPSIKDCPVNNLPEFAFIGRSNVGKSSLINMITARKSLAMISGKPGKTRLINHFLINDSWYLVDLPGYGFARVSKSKKADWDKMLNNYLLLRKNLACVFLLIDSRLEPKINDIDFVNWLGQNHIPFQLLFTKEDKQSRNKTDSTVAKFRKALKPTWEIMPGCIITSATVNTGRKELLDFISKVIKEMNN